jgi:transposase, IS30 family
MRTYKQLTYEQRCQIEALKKSGISQQAIATLIGVSQPSVSRELARNTGERGYRHNQAQQKSIERRQTTVNPHKMTAELIDEIEDKLWQKWSPEQISGLATHESRYLH